MGNILVRLIGWRATVLHGDPTVYDRWIWLRNNLVSGPLRTLDAGCGSGAFTLYASKIGNYAVGLSDNERNNQVAQDRANILGITNVKFLTIDLRELDELAESLGKFEQIICCEAIEHIKNDRKLIKDISDMLSAGGRLLLTTPSINLRPLKGDRISEYEDGGHVRLGYTHETLRTLFNECELEVVKEGYLSGYVSWKISGLMQLPEIYRLGRVSGIIVWALTFPLRMFQVLDRRITNLIGHPYHCISIVAIKKE